MDEAIRLMFETNGPAVMDGLRKEAANYKALIEDLGQQFARGDISADQFTAALGKLGNSYERSATTLRKFEDAQQAEASAATRATAAIEAQSAALAAAGPKVYDLADAYELVERAETDVAAAARVAGTAVESSNARMTPGIKAAGAATDDARNKMTGLNTAIRGVGFGISDVFANQGPIGSRIGGFANNIGGIITGIGQAAGKMGPQLLVAAAGLEIGLTAIGAALNAFGLKSTADFVALWTGAIKRTEAGVDGLKKRIEELEAKPVKLAIDLVQIREATTQLATLEKNLAAFRAMEASRTDMQQKAAAAAGQVIQEAGGPDLARKLREKAAKDIEATDPQATEAKARAEAARAKADEKDRAARAAEIDEEILQGKRPMADRVPRPPRAPGAPIIPTEQLRKEADAAIEEAKAADEALRARREQIRDPEKGEAAARVGGAREAAARGDVGPLNAMLKGVGKGDLAHDLEQTTPAALKAQEEAKKVLGGLIETTVGGWANVLRVQHEKVAQQWAAAAAERANKKNLAPLGDQTSVEEVVNIPPKVPRKLTVPEQKAKALKAKIEENRAAAAARLERGRRANAPIRRGIEGRMVAPPGFRSGVPLSVASPKARRPVPNLAPRPTVALTPEQQRRADEQQALMDQFDKDRDAREEKVRGVIDRFDNRPHPKGPADFGGPSNERMGTPAADLSPVAGVNQASIERDRAAQHAAGEMIQTMNTLAAAHQQNGAGWQQIAAAAQQIRGNIKIAGR